MDIFSLFFNRWAQKYAKGWKPTDYVLNFPQELLCSTLEWQLTYILVRWELLDPFDFSDLCMCFKFLNAIDQILINLRKPGETGYKIPNGGMFNYVTGANFFGEIVEWTGFALASCSSPAAVFAFFSASFLGLRAWHHHKFYLSKFEDYPKSRKIIIPFVL